MAVYFNTTDAAGLLADFKSEISAGHIREWRVDNYGDLEHTPGSYAQKVYLRPVCEPSGLKLNIKFYPSTKSGKRELFGIISGRVIEMFIAHCWTGFTKGSFTEMAEDGDDGI